MVSGGYVEELLPLIDFQFPNSRALTSELPRRTRQSQKACPWKGFFHSGMSAVGA